MITTKSQMVLQFGRALWDTVVFIHPDVDETPENQGNNTHTVHKLDKRKWEEMGKPTIITVTIEVGDTLNE